MKIAKITLALFAAFMAGSCIEVYRANKKFNPIYMDMSEEIKDLQNLNKTLTIRSESALVRMKAWRTAARALYSGVPHDMVDDQIRQDLDFAKLIHKML